MLFLWLAAIVVALVCLLYLAPQAYRYFQTRRWRRLSGMVALTYDDGPDNVTSRALMDLLDEYKVKATFYLVGFRAERAFDVVQDLHLKGHELGTHSYSHKHAWRVAPWTEYRDAERGYATLRSVVGQKAPYRPPFGKISLVTMLAMLLRGRRVDWWSQPTNDTDDEFEDPQVLAERLLAEQQRVILMHSHHDEPHRRDFMLAVTRALIEQASAQGLRLVTMAEMTSGTRGPA